MHKKFEKLLDLLQSFEKVAIAFSGGVDSAFLLYSAHKALGENADAVTVSHEFIPEREIGEAREFCCALGISQKILTIDMLKREEIVANPNKRCYLCKKAIMETILQAAISMGCNVLLDGSNADDAQAERPGEQALRELGVRSPLAEVGLTKQEIRLLSKEKGLSTWDKLSFSCLATRIPFETKITGEALRRIDEAEVFLQTLGFDLVRVRSDGHAARIELAPEKIKAAQAEACAKKITEELRRIGYKSVTIDPEGYKIGGANKEQTRSKQGANKGCNGSKDGSQHS